VQDDGTLDERYEYDPYGKVYVLNADFGLDSSGGDGKSDVDNLILFQGLMLDEETGLIYNRYRYLHATLGRFCQRDPLGYVDGGHVRLDFEPNSDPMIHAQYGPNNQDTVKNRYDYKNRKWEKQVPPKYYKFVRDKHNKAFKEALAKAKRRAREAEKQAAEKARRELLRNVGKRGLGKAARFGTKAVLGAAGLLLDVLGGAEAAQAPAPCFCVCTVLRSHVLYANPEDQRVIDDYRSRSLTAPSASGMANVGQVWFEWEGETRCKAIELLLENRFGGRTESKVIRFTLPNSPKVLYAAVWEEVNISCGGPHE